MEKVHSTLDVYQSAWIYLTTGIYPDLQHNNNKVSFNFPLNEKVIQSIGRFNSGEKIEALKFTLTVKNLKAQIFQMKGH